MAVPCVLADRAHADLRVLIVRRSVDDKRENLPAPL